VIHLAYFEGLSQAEIAQRTHAPLGTVKLRLRSALSNLERLLRRTHARTACARPRSAQAVTTPEGLGLEGIDEQGAHAAAHEEDAEHAGRRAAST
jgi:hypothetical protein